MERRIDQYSQISIIGRGGFGTVYMSEHKNSKVRVAVKRIDKVQIKRMFGRKGQDFSELVAMQATCRAQVPQLVDLIDCFEDVENFYTVTRLMPDGNLRDFINNRITLDAGFIQEEEARHIMHQLALGVKALHDRRVIHRDIKTSNVLIQLSDGKIYVKLADFGCAAILDTRTTKRVFRIGTMGYMAPEMLRDEPFGLGYDIWSLGALFYSLFAL